MPANRALRTDRHRSGPGKGQNDLIAFAKENSLPRSAARLEEMQTRLKRDGYTSFWR